MTASGAAVARVPLSLEMVRPHLEALPPVQAPSGYTLRTFRPGDEADWARIMNQCVGRGWTARRCRRELVERAEFSADGCFLVTHGGVPQGAASAWWKPEYGSVGRLHMLGVAPTHRGAGLGRALTLAVLHRLRRQRLGSAVLHTDEFRLAAIATYLRLGFEPVLFDARHAARWSRVRSRLVIDGGALAAVSSGAAPPA